ncbi:MAG: hypothetical protein QG622_1719 [Actinomycetota bacterium]|nr:hypothetical protein [Actinomycetota bacterium]
MVTASSIRRRGAARTSVFVAGSAALVLGLPGCSSERYYYARDSESVQVCYDKVTQEIVDDNQCDNNGDNDGDDDGGSGRGHFVHGYYHGGSYVPAKGQKITERGASLQSAPRAGTSTVRGSSVSRGGFGGSHGSVGG